VATILAFAAMPAVPSFAQEAPPDFSEITSELTPSVVAITTQRAVEEEDIMEMIPPELRERFEERFGQPLPEQDGPAPPEAQAQGSGFLISEEGHIVTNNHVIADATDIQVVLADGSSQPAELVGTDPATDLAVLQIADMDGAAVAEWGDSEAIQPGAWTIAIGSPFGLGGSVTVGVLSARSRDIRTGPYDDYLQTDASINRGNSGGPLFDADGEVIGVNTAIFSPTGVNVGIGFAVPSRTAQPVVEELIETGEVRRGFIGVQLQPLTDAMARALRLETAEGALIAQIEPGEPAEAAGLQPGDVVLELDGQPIADPRALSFAVAERDPGDEAALTIQRRGERMEIQLTLGAREFDQPTAAIEPEPTPDVQEEGQFGLSLSPLPDTLRQELEIEEGGAMVQRVQPGGLAAEAGIMQNDVILEAGDEPVIEPADLAAAWDEARADDRPLVLRIQRGEMVLFVAVEG
jgi:serine protease Do